MADVTVSDNRNQSRFEARVGDELAGFAEYRREGEEVTFPHTEVLPQFEGQGVASALARASLDAVRNEGVTRVVPACTFYARWIEKHPDYQDLVNG